MPVAITTRKTIALLALGSWALEALYMIFQLHSLQTPIIIYGYDVTSEIVTRGLERALWITLGGGSAILALKSLQHWAWASISSAALYLLVWYLIDVTRHLPIGDAYSLKWMTAIKFGTVGGFFIRDVILPIAFSTVILGVVSSLVVRWTRSLHV